MAESDQGSVSHRIELARGGDANARAWLWERYRRLLYVMAHDGLGQQRSGAADTSDVVAEVALRFSGADLAGIQDRTHFQNWLRQIVRGKRIDLARRETVRPTTNPFADDSSRAPAAPAESDFVHFEMRDLLNALPLTLHETASALMERGDERATAEALGITRHEVRNRIVAIREIWAKSLGEE